MFSFIQSTSRSPYTRSKQVRMFWGLTFFTYVYVKSVITWQYSELSVNKNCLLVFFLPLGITLTDRYVIHLTWEGKISTQSSLNFSYIRRRVIFFLNISQKQFLIFCVSVLKLIWTRVLHTGLFSSRVFANGFALYLIRTDTVALRRDKLKKNGFAQF